MNEAFLQGETREGFYIRPMMKRTWAVQLDILASIDALCKRHGITYYASSGTLLGAVRHKGFVPWDDDIDLEMTRKEYNKFLIYKDELTEEGLFVRNDEGCREFESGVQVSNGTNISTNEAWLNRWYGCPYTLGVDIFVMENAPDNPAECQQWETLMFAAVNLAKNAPEGALYDDLPADVASAVTQLCGLMNKTIDHGRAVKPQLFQLADEVSSQYQNKNTKRMVNIFDSEKKFFKYWYRSYSWMKFEDTEVPVPVGYEHILREWYGKDWRTPVQGLAWHEYPGYGKQERRLKEEYKRLGVEVPPEFDMDD